MGVDFGLPKIMAARKSPSLPDATPATISTEPAPYTGHQDHSFTLQVVMELQKSVGALEATIKANTTAIDKLDARIGRTEEKTESRLEGVEGKLDARLGRVEEKLSEVTKKIYAAGAILGILVWVVSPVSAEILRMVIAFFQKT
jgi:hypothetical protein